MMTVRELIELLKTKPQDAEVIITWESTEHGISDETVYMSHGGQLVLDADGCQDKESIMTGVNPYASRPGD